MTDDPKADQIDFEELPWEWTPGASPPMTTRTQKKRRWSLDAIKERWRAWLLRKLRWFLIWQLMNRTVFLRFPRQEDGYVVRQTYDTRIREGRGRITKVMFDGSGPPSVEITIYEFATGAQTWRRYSTGLNNLRPIPRSGRQLEVVRLHALVIL